eukprot:GDKI01034843.1.p1 GENE.GDKI01034843.1~~GDKI01034843.1.p1  ORF type:complete len:404 (+),score=64.36 GDKI01034843.1:82-1293(+)
MLQRATIRTIGVSSAAVGRVSFALQQKRYESCGLVGYPNVGKSTLFNALAQAQLAQAENYPFCTIDPNITKTIVPDKRLEHLAKICGCERVVPGQVEIRDIAGLIKGASEGAGMGNQFLSHIRGVNAILHVVRCFVDPKITHVEDAVNLTPIKEYESVLTELLISDLEVASKRVPAMRRKASNDQMSEKLLPIYEKALKALENGKTVRSVLDKDEMALAGAELPFISSKPTLVICNVEAESAKEGNELSRQLSEYIHAQGDSSLVISAKLESEACGLKEGGDDGMYGEYLESYGLKEPALRKVLTSCLKMLDLSYYYTAGKVETRAWFINRGAKAPEAAGVIHGDFQKGFLSCDVWKYEDVVQHGSMDACRKAGKMKTKGKDYTVEEGDILEFRHKFEKGKGK